VDIRDALAFPNRLRGRRNLLRSGAQTSVPRGLLAGLWPVVWNSGVPFHESGRLAVERPAHGRSLPTPMAH